VQEGEKPSIKPRRGDIIIENKWLLYSNPEGVTLQNIISHAKTQKPQRNDDRKFLAKSKP
jgi:hypothetical protein